MVYIYFHNLKVRYKDVYMSVNITTDPNYIPQLYYKLKILFESNKNNFARFIFSTHTAVYVFNPPSLT